MFNRATSIPAASNESITLRMNLPEAPGSSRRWTAIEIVHGSDDYRCTVALRERILRFPLGLSFSPEELERESADIHVAVFDQASVSATDAESDQARRHSRCLACLVLTPLARGSFKMRQVAVDVAFQRSGLGTFLVRRAEEIAGSLGAGMIFCHAREPVVPFYQRLGYVVVGEWFEEVGIPHRRMERRLDA